MSSLKHRQDIDGLRAISVMAVIIFHLNPKYLSGGFGGVDVFFVISGFLITTLILNGLDAQTFSLKEFYRKRILRILPMLNFTLISCTLLGYLLLAPTELQHLSDAITSCFFFVSNFFFEFFDGNYFHNIIDSPLLHTWSLSIEEQYYLIFPLLLLLLTKRILPLLTMVFIASMIASAYYFYSEELIHVFYSTPLRIPGILAGSITAVVTKRYQHSSKLLIWLSLLTLFASFIFIDDTNFFSLTCLGFILPTVFLLNSNLSQGLAMNALTSAPLGWLGVRSYSLYLVHWPVIAFLRYFEIDQFIINLSVLPAIFIAHMTYTWIEQTFRYRSYSFKQALYFFYITPMILFLGFALLVQKTNGLEFRFPSEVLKLEHSIPKDTNFFGKPVFGQYLHQSNTATKHYVLYGDSHAGHFMAFAREVARKLDFNLSVLAVGGCCPGTEEKKDHADKTGKRKCKRLLEVLKKNLTQYDGVILAGHYKTKLGLDWFPDSFKRLVKNITDADKQLIVLSQVPELSYAHNFQTKAFVARFNLNLTDSPQINPKYALANEHIQKLLKEYPHSYIDFDKVLKINDKVITYTKDNTYLYSDADHLNVAGSEYLAQLFLSSENMQKEREIFKQQ